MKINEGNDGTKIYTPKKFSQNNSLEIFVLFHDVNKDYVKRMEKKLYNKKIDFYNGLKDTNIAFHDKVDIVNYYDYLVVVVSEQLLKDLDSLDILLDNFSLYGDNEKILPLILWKDLYKPNIKADVIENYKKEIDEYEEKYSTSRVGQHELKRMKKIYEMLENFLEFATNRDKKANKMSGDNKILSYIFSVSGRPVADKEICVESGDKIVKQTIYNVGTGGQLNVANDGATINANVKND